MNVTNRSENLIEVKTEYFGNMSQDDDMMVLEIIAEKLIKILEKSLDSINKYKSILPYLNEYNIKKGYLSILINTKDVLNQNAINDLKRKIVSLNCAFIIVISINFLTLSQFLKELISKLMNCLDKYLCIS